MLEGLDEEKVVEEVCTEAKNMAIDAGADPASVRIATIENMPLQYVQMKASRILVRAVSTFLSCFDTPAESSILIHPFTGWYIESKRAA